MSTAEVMCFHAALQLIGPFLFMCWEYAEIEDVCWGFVHENL